MKWQEKIVCRILLIVARIVGKYMADEQLKEILDLSRTIEYSSYTQEKSNV